MPTYDYACADCGGTFEVRATFGEKQKGLEPVCPKCGNKSAVQVFGSVAILFGSKGGASPCRFGGGPNCCPGTRK
jgi:putative FmdB family regulatory protein